MQLAPVIIQVYTRKNHFINCIESLYKCRLAEQTHLFIASDSPKTESDEMIVKEIRNYCTSIVGFKKVDLLTSEKNMGAALTGQNAIARVLSEYSEFIYSEDDNVFTLNFLEYMNEGLEFYKNNPFVFAICGYKHPFQIPGKYSKTFFTSTVISPWGLGMWKQKYSLVDLHPKDYQKYKNKKRMSLVWHSLMESIGSGNVYGDSIFEYHCLKNDMVNIFPFISLVRNYGNDGSGVHSGNFKEYKEQEISNGEDKIIFNNEIEINKEIEKRLIDAIDYPFQKGLKKVLLKIKIKIKLPIKRYIINRPKLKRIIFKLLQKS
jgi:hypothetical protein